MKRWIALLLLAAPLAGAQVRSIPEDARVGQIRHLQEMVVEIDGAAQQLAPERGSAMPRTASSSRPRSRPARESNISSMEPAKYRWCGSSHLRKRSADGKALPAQRSAAR